MRPERRAAAVLLALAAGLTPPARPAAAAEPFYLAQLRDGITAYDRKDYAAAARELRLACFGLLEEPAPLADCLVRLGLAQAAAGDGDGFQTTFRRLSEVEERFTVYAKLALPPDLRAAFEQRAAAAIPASILAAVPAFAPWVTRQGEAQVAALPPKERRRELEARLAREPRNGLWPYLLAELEFEEGQTAAAVKHAEQAVALAPQDQRMLCLRGLTRSWVRRCPDALADLAGCPRTAREPRYATALLGCQVELGQWRQAEAVVGSLPRELRQERAIAGLITRVQQHSPKASGALDPPRPTAPSAPDQAADGPPKAAGAKPAPATAPDRPAVAGPELPGGRAKPAAPALSAADRDGLDRARGLLHSAQARDLRQAFDLARAVADAHPESRDAQLLAGEAAYRNSRWREAASYLKRGGEPLDERPELLFYLAVALYESGDARGAASALKRTLPNLQKTPYVESYARRILGPGGGR